VGHAYRLELPQHLGKLHPVFAAERLRRAPNDPLPGQTPEPQPPILIDNELEYEVERIRASRLDRGILRYQADWTACDRDDDWYPASDFKGAPHKLRQFHEEFPAAAGPPKRLDEWLRAYEDGLDNPDEHPDDDLPADALKAGPNARRLRWNRKK
jgi:hypothetical protein